MVFEIKRKKGKKRKEKEKKKIKKMILKETACAIIGLAFARKLGGGGGLDFLIV